MDTQFQIFFDKMKEEMDRQTTTITNNLLEKMDEKLQPLLIENKMMKEKFELLEKNFTKWKTERKETIFYFLD